MSRELHNFDVIKSPLVTEKSTDLSKNNQVVFKVDIKSNKSEIKDAIEKIFKVKVKAINIIKSKGKVKIFKGKKGKRIDSKKAIVSLKEGETIDFSSGV